MITPKEIARLRKIWKAAKGKPWYSTDHERFCLEARDNWNPLLDEIERLMKDSLKLKCNPGPISDGYAISTSCEICAMAAATDSMEEIRQSWKLVPGMYEFYLELLKASKPSAATKESAIWHWNRRAYAIPRKKREKWLKLLRFTANYNYSEGYDEDAAMLQEIAAYLEKMPTTREWNEGDI